MTRASFVSLLIALAPALSWAGAGSIDGGQVSILNISTETAVYSTTMKPLVMRCLAADGVTFESCGGGGSGVVTTSAPVLGVGSVADPIRVDPSSVTLLGPVIDSAEVSFNYAGSSSKGGAATSVASGGVDFSTITTALNAKADTFVGISSVCAAGQYLSSGTWSNGVLVGGGCVPVGGVTGSTWSVVAGDIIPTDTNNNIRITKINPTFNIENNSTSQYSQAQIVFDTTNQASDIRYVLSAEKLSAGSGGSSSYFIRRQTGGDWLDYARFNSAGTNDVTFNYTKSAGLSYGPVNIANGDFQRGGNSVAWMTHFQQASSDRQSSTTGGFTNKTTLTTGSLPSGTYRIGLSAEIAESNATYDTLLRVQVNGADVANINEEFQDTANWLPKSGFYYHTGSGVTTVTLDFGSDNTLNTASIRRARLELWRVQ